MYAIQNTVRKVPRLLNVCQNQRRTVLATPPRVRIPFLVSTIFIKRTYIRSGLQQLNIYSESKNLFTIKTVFCLQFEKHFCEHLYR